MCHSPRRNPAGNTYQQDVQWTRPQELRYRFRMDPSDSEPIDGTIETERTQFANTPQRIVDQLNNPRGEEDVIERLTHCWRWSDACS